MKNIDWLLKTPIAHRGLHDETIPENSLSSFKKAVENGFNIETDVRLTKDKKVVLFHDDNLLRMCKNPKKISKLTYEELLSMNLAQSNERIPLLADLLSIAQNKVGLLIELKSDGTGELESLVYDQVKNYDGLFAIQSFHPYSVKWFKDNAPELTRGLLATYVYPKELNFFHAFALKHLLLFKKVEPDFLSYDENYIAKPFLRKYKVPRLAWTVRHKERAEEILKNGLADNIIFENFIP